MQEARHSLVRFAALALLVPSKLRTRYTNDELLALVVKYKAGEPEPKSNSGALRSRCGTKHMERSGAIIQI